ncbi:MAG: hypothetical protein ACI4T2_03255 [Christensenellales bacterium]
MGIAYNDFQIFSPQVMEQLARAYFEKRQNQNQKLDDLLSSLQFLYSQLERTTFQKQNIIALKKIMNKNIEYFAKNNKKLTQKTQTLQNNSQNYLIRKIIITELKVIKLSRASQELMESHIENIEKLLTTF